MSMLERRRYYRTNVTDTWAHCVCDQTAGRYSVEDLSQSGVLLSNGPMLEAETQIRIQLHIPGGDPISLDGEVLRCSDLTEEPSHFAVKFGYLAEDEQERIQAFIVQKLIHELSPLVLVAGTDGWERKALIRSIRAIGYNPVSVDTPLCVIRYLGFLRRPVSAVVLGSRFGRKESLTIAAFLADQYPQTRRIMVSRPSWRTRRAADDVMHTIVRKPWTEKQLKEAISGA